MKRGLALLPAAALGACVAGPAPDIAMPAPELPASFAYVPVEGAGDIASLLPREDTAFDRLASQALAGSPSVLEALARIDRARATARGAAADRLPSIGADGNITASRTNPGNFPDDLPFDIETEQVVFAANVTARWDPDLFGVLRAREQAALLRLDAARADVAAVRLALVSEIAASVIDWRTLDARVSELENDRAAADELARLARVREVAGISPGFDRVRAQSAAAASASRLAALENERARLLGRLVTLTTLDGRQVQLAFSASPPPRELVALPAAAPSLLLVNRPDIARAEAQLLASDADLAAIARRRFPQVNLSAAIGLLAFGIGGVFDENSLVASLGAGLAAPLLDFGRIEAEIDAGAADTRAAFQRYRAAVFTALGDAEGAYALVRAADAQADRAREERDTAQRAADLADVRFRAGLADFLTVLEARRSADASGERAALALGQARRARVVLWQALGGSPRPAQTMEGSVQNGDIVPSPVEK